MYSSNQKVPIGKLLKELGLVSEKQIQIALKTQARYNKMRLGEILALQGAVPQRSVDFFVEKWEEVRVKGKQYPIGYYFKKAGLLQEEQIKIILAEQKKNQLKFGAIANQKGWLNQETIDFFLANLTPKPPQLISLNTLETYNRKTLHLEQKVANPTLVLQEILSWTGGHSILSKILCQILANSDLIILKGQEKITVTNLVKDFLIDNWRTQKTADYIRTVANNLLYNQNCNPKLLLETYQKILLRGEIFSNNSIEQQELLNLGIAIAANHRLKVANPIYQYVFNLNWVEEQLVKIRQSQDIIQTNLEQNRTQPITKLASIVTLLAILLLAPLVIILNNNYSKLKPKLNLPSSTSSDADELLQLCQGLISPETESQVNLIVRLEESKQNLQESFPAECETMLQKLWVLAAPQLGKENRVIEAINYLCKIPSDSDNFNQAKIWLNRWYNSPTWGEQTKAYLKLVPECPPADDEIIRK